MIYNLAWTWSFLNQTNIFWEQYHTNINVLFLIVSAKSSFLLHLDTFSTKMHRNVHIPFNRYLIAFCIDKSEIISLNNKDIVQYVLS